MEAMTILEVTDYLKVSESHIRNLCNMGEIPHIRLGKRILVDKEDLDKWLQKKKIGGTK